MSDALRLGWSQGEAAARAGQYRLALGAYLLVYTVAGLVLILAPGAIAHAGPHPVAHGWLRPLGGLLLLVAALQLPAWQNAVRSRVTALIATLGRFLLALLWLVAGGALVWAGLFEALCAVGLAALLYRYFTAELMSRP
jgi:hypothetical protein